MTKFLFIEIMKRFIKKRKENEGGLIRLRIVSTERGSQFLIIIMKISSLKA